MFGTRRRDFITLLGGAAAWPLAARTQQPAMPVIGYLGLTSANADAYVLASFRKGLSEAGFDEGRNVTIDCRFAERDVSRLPALAAEFVAGKVTVVFTATTVSALAMKAALQPFPPSSRLAWTRSNRVLWQVSTVLEAISLA